MVHTTKDQIMKSAGETGKDYGVLLGSMVVAHNAVKMLKKQDSIVVNGTGAVAGFVGAVMLKNPMLKMACLAASAVCFFNTATIAVKVPETGAKALIPESIASKLRAYIPSLQGIDELSGDYDFSGIPSMDDAAKTIDVTYETISSVSGLGNTANKLM